MRGVRKEDRTPGRQDAEGASLQLQVQRDEPGQGLGEARAQGQSSLEPGDERSLPGEDQGAGESVLAGRGDDVPQEGNYANVKYVRPRVGEADGRKDGYIMEHRLLMAGKVGRLLTRTGGPPSGSQPAEQRLTNLELWPTNGRTGQRKVADLWRVRQTADSSRSRHCAQAGV